ncbi:MAG: HmuY family protein [Chitinophagaceae bacterium]|nr:HmuY family protein [Chitinophagaceae bacterium]
MMRLFIRSFLWVLWMASLLISSCRKREVALPDNYVGFENTSSGMAANENSITVKLKTIYNINAQKQIILKVTETGAAYGVKYTTVPAVQSGKIILVIPSGNNQVSFTINRMPNVLFDGDEKLVFELESSESPLLIGTSRSFTLSFSEIVANQPSMIIQGGGALFPNKVFVDLSANRQTAVLRTTWDLGFYTVGNEYRVILNSSTGMMAKAIQKTDISAVNSADTAGLTNELTFNQANPQPSQLPYIDYPNGDLTRTAIAAISPNPSENKVYIINRGVGVGNPMPSRGWKKVRILRNPSGGYTLQHADINSSTFATVEIPRDDTYFFRYVSFENGLVNVEPPKKKWDFAWTFFSNVTSFGGSEVPYLFQDIILINRNVEAARVMTSAKAFENFTESDLNGLTFSSLQNVIGADWRSGGGPNTPPAIRTDRYYIIKDGDNNIYKLRFTSLTQNGERGYPAFEAVLVKKGV